MGRPLLAVDFSRFEGLLASRLSTYAGMVFLVPLLILYILNGSITFRPEPRSELEIQRILAPPQPRSAPRIDFEQRLVPERTARPDAPGRRRRSSATVAGSGRIDGALGRF